MADVGLVRRQIWFEWSPEMMSNASTKYYLTKNRPHLQITFGVEVRQTDGHPVLVVGAEGVRVGNELRQ